MGAVAEAENLMALKPLDRKQVMTSVEGMHAKFWEQFSQLSAVREAGVPHRKAATYCTLFKQGDAPRMPGYSSLPGLLHSDILAVARFRLGSHFLMVERERFRRVEWKDRVCTRCAQQAVDDEYDMVFECGRFQAARDEVWRLAVIPSDLTCSNLVDFGDVRVCTYIAKCMPIQKYCLDPNLGTA
jgi:hypothetical protein